MAPLSPTSRAWVLKAQTAIWTGDADRKGERTVTTGLLGSLRWWFEVLVRGLGGSACDPSDSDGRCPDNKGKHCVVCELFGCTGGARKFRFDVLEESGKIKRDQIKKDEKFHFRFTPLRPMRDEEWALLDLTLRLIADYGAIGGKTVLKPSEEANRQNLPHHEDYGVISIEDFPRIQGVSKDALRAYVRDSAWRRVEHHEFAWAALNHFWCVRGRSLRRQSEAKSTFNRVVGRNEQKQQGQQLRQGANGAERWLAGGQAESKKVFSFKDQARTFGFVNQGTIDFGEMKQRLKGIWPDLKDGGFVKGDEVLKRLLNA